VDNSAKFADGSFKRIAHHIQLDTEWVWASMNAFTTEADKIGLPVDWDISDSAVTGVTVLTNAAKLQSFNGMTQGVGDVEFWSTCCGGVAPTAAVISDVDRVPLDDVPPPFPSGCAHVFVGPPVAPTRQLLRQRRWHIQRERVPRWYRGLLRKLPASRQ
jgi:hypothetical protein